MESDDDDLKKTLFNDSEMYQLYIRRYHHQLNNYAFFPFPFPFDISSAHIPWNSAAFIVFRRTWG
jgi:hypothetical protein